MSDCAINIHPTEDELVEIAGESAACARIFGVDPKVAFLSYSTLGSGKGEDVDKMRNAAHKAREKYPDLPIEGNYSLMQQYHQELQEQSARILQLPDMQIPLFSRISMPEISDTRLHRDLVISKLTVRFC